MKYAILAAMAAALVSGCSLSGPATEPVQGCDWTAYILVGEGDVLTEETAADILVHNETRKRICG